MRSTLNGVRIAGISAAVPSHSEEILEGGYLTAEGRKRFVDSTGIERRRLAAPDQWCSDFAAAAAERLLDDLGWDRGDIAIAAADLPTVSVHVGLNRSDPLVY